MREDDMAFLVPFAESESIRFRTSLEHILAIGGKINMGYEEGSFSIPIPVLGGEVKGSYSINDGWLRIRIDESPGGMSLEDIKKMYIEHLGFSEEDLPYT